MKAICITVWAGLCTSFAAHALTPQQKLDAFMQQQAPAGWAVQQYAVGDLNKDRLADVALVVEQKDPAKMIPNDNLGAKVLNLNPRRLVIGLQTAQGYALHSSLDGLIPSENSEEAPCLADTFEPKSLSIAKNVLVLNLSYWLSCGSYATSQDTYRFRLDATQRFRLIGHDTHESHRASGETHSSSRNLLTGRQIDEYGNFSEDKPDKVKRSRFKLPPVQYLDAFKLQQ